MTKALEKMSQLKRCRVIVEDARRVHNVDFIEKSLWDLQTNTTFVVDVVDVNWSAGNFNLTRVFSLHKRVLINQPG
jgi:hypothetical protein